MEKRLVSKLKINGEWTASPVSRGQTLLDFIREDLNLTGTKKGCGTGDCGSCVVLINGRARTTCNLPVSKVQGQEITTIEGLVRGNRLHPIQEAFIEAGAIQCGYCTPGMVLRTKDLLDHLSNPTELQIKDALNGHICRCTGYVKIIEAIKLAAEKLKGSAEE
jgi:carbon-monoxide dehydrogenase small subunit